MSRSLLWRVVGLGALVIGLVAASLVYGVPSESALREQFAASGVWGYLAFIGLYGAIALLPVPKNVLSVAAGAVFGSATGLAVVVSGATLGAVVAFGIGRLLGRDVVLRHAGKSVRRLDAALLRKGLLSILVARLVPVVPFTALNYLSGATAVRFRDYLIATALGILPGTSAYVALGAYGHKPSSLPFISAAIALVLLSAIGIAAGVRRNRRLNSADS